MSLDTIEKDLAKVLKKEIAENIDVGFVEKRNPRGKSWKITKAGHSFDPNDTIRNSIRVKSSSNEITITSTKDYTIYHQEGTSRLPQREMYPEDYFPKRWDKIEDKIDDFMEDIFQNLEISK